MKVFYWTPYMGNVGTIKATINSAAAIKKWGYEVKLYKIYHEWEGYEEMLEQHGIEVIDLGLGKKFSHLPENGLGFRFSMLIYSLFSYFKLKRNWEKEQPDVIIASLLGYLPLVVRRHAKHKPKIVNSIQGRPRFNPVRRFIWKRSYAKSDLLVTLSDETRNEILKTFSFQNKRVVRLDNPVIDDQIDHLMTEPLNDPDLEGEKHFILGVGRLTRQKNFATLIQAFGLLKRQDCNKIDKLLILGEGEERKMLENQIESLGLEGDVILKGFTANPYKYMHQADVFVLSSLWEDAGHVLLEAAYTKAPIVSTRCPSGQEEFLDYGEGGELCEIENPKDMAECIQKVLNRKNNDKIETAYRKSLNYKSEVHGENLHRLLQKLVGMRA